jgi:DNA mismatch repair ATPase MutS
VPKSVIQRARQKLHELEQSGHPNLATRRTLLALRRLASRIDRRA